jgi:hypothetical protein
MKEEEIVELFHDKFCYDPETGVIKYRRNHSRYKKGDVPGSINEAGYLRVCLDNKVYMAHRLIYLVMTGSWPVGVIDHIDGDPLNNKWENLRDVSKTVNGRNTKRQKNNTSGFRGVSWVKGRLKWQAYISTGSGRVSLGLFDMLEEAILARVEAEMLYWSADDRKRKAEFDF